MTGNTIMSPHARGRTGQGIPRRLVHVYCPPAGSPPELPLLYKAAAANATLLNPDFEHVLFNAEKMAQFLKDEPACHRQAMESFRFPIQRFDFFRLLAIYRLGGIYMDLDVLLARDLAPLLDYACVFPFEELTLNSHLRQNCNLDWELGNFAFGAVAGHPFIKALIENCMRAQKDPPWAQAMMKGIPPIFRTEFFVVNTTGPAMISRTFAEHPELQETVCVLFPNDVCDDRTWHRFGNYGLHLMNASWRKRGSFVYTRLARLWEVQRRKRFLKQSAKLGPSRLGNWRTLPC